jgi:hypothetical protein
MEIRVRSGKVRHEGAAARRASDETAAVGFSAVLEVTHELGEAVEVERAAVRVQEILLSRSVDGVVVSLPDV